MAETPYPEPPMPRALTWDEYSHMSHRWTDRSEVEGVYDEVFTPCEDQGCYACSVGRDMMAGRYQKAATEDGVPTWLLPDSRRPEEAEEDWKFFLEGRTDHIDPKAVWKK